MKFEYNGNLSLEDRINLVTKEINSVYPEVKNAYLSALLEVPITTSVTEEMIFRRLYNIMLTNKFDSNIVNRIINDMIKLYKNIRGKNEKIDSFMIEIVNYSFTKNNFPKFD